MSRRRDNSAKFTFEFALIIGGMTEVEDQDVDALFEAGCEDGTVSIQFGRVFIEFSRDSTTLLDAVLSAIRDVERAGIGAIVTRIDDPDLVNQSEIARRIGRSRQLIHQYIAAVRGPGGFPPPECGVVEEQPMWSWRAVSEWLAHHGLIDHELAEEASTIAAINAALSLRDERRRSPDLVDAVERRLGRCG